MNSYIDYVIDLETEIRKKNKTPLGGKIYITLNPHRNELKTPREFLKEDLKTNLLSERETEIAKECNKLDKLATIQLYFSPSEFYFSFGPSLEDAARELIEKLTNYNIIVKNDITTKYILVNGDK